MSTLKPKNRKPFIITKPIQAILKAIHFYRYMAAQDVAHLLYSPKSLTYVRSILSTLSGGKDVKTAQYLYSFRLPSVSAGGSEKIWTLGSKGRDYLANGLGLPVDFYYRPHKVRHASYGAILHNLILTRTLIAASLWAKKQSNFKLVKTRICYELARKAPSIQLTDAKGDREQVKIIPDAWLLFQKLSNNKHERFYQVLIEIDRGMEFQKRFKKAIQARLEFIKDSGAYNSLFGAMPNNVIIAWITTGDRPEYRESRRKAMCDWTRDVLAQNDHNNLSCSFLFCSAVASELYNIPLFDGAGWFSPGAPSPVSLFSP